MTLHCHNWKASNLVEVSGVKAACGIRRGRDALADEPGRVTCDGCGLKALREGQGRGLDVERVREWTWANFGATPSPLEAAVVVGG